MGILINRDKINFLTRCHRPVEPLAYPARFERATFALEGCMTAGISIYSNGLQCKNGTV